MAAAKSFADFYPIMGIDSSSSIIVSKNADLTIALRLVLPELLTLSSGDYGQLYDTFLRACKVLPIGYVVHKQDLFLPTQFQPDFNALRPVTAGHIHQHNELHFSDRPFLEHDCYLYITRPAAPVHKRTSLQSSLFKTKLVPKELQDEKVVAQFVDIVGQFAAMFSGLASATVLTRDELAGIAAVPGQRMAVPGLYDQYFTLRAGETSLHDVQFEGGLQVGGQFTHTLAISELGDWPLEFTNQVTLGSFSSDTRPVAGSTGSFFGLLLPVPHVYNQVVVIEDPDELSKRLVSEQKKHISFGQWSKENEVAAVEKNDFLGAMKSQGLVPVRAHLNVLVFGPSVAEAEAYRSEAAAQIAKLGFRPRVVTAEANALYWSCIPGNIAEIGVDNLSTCFLEQAVSAFNLETNYQDETYCKNGIRLTDRFGMPIMLDLFFKPMEKGTIASRNFLVVGPSGSGKSVFTNNMAYYLLAQGTHVTLVDVGHSYKRLAQQMGGRYITLSEDNPLSFNPFHFGETPPEDQVNMVQTILAALLYQTGDTVTKAQETTLRDMVYRYFKNLKEARHSENPIVPCFDTFYEFARDVFPDLFEQNGGRLDKEFDMNNFLYVLKPFYNGGQFDYLLNSTTNIDLVEHPFVVYELDAIKNHQVLYPITVLMIMNNYVRKLMEVKGPLKVLLIEEAWSALANDKFANFLQWAIKTVRKHYGALGVVTQEINDLVGNSVVKDSIVSNSPIKILLDQSDFEQRYDDIATLLGLSEKQQAIVLSIGKYRPPHRSNFREAAILLGEKGAKVYGVELSPTAFASFTTEKKDVLEIEDLARYRYGGNMTQATMAWGRGERVAALT